MVDHNIDLGTFENKKDEDRNMLDSMFDDYVPIQKNSKLFKFLLYTTKVEIKSNSLIKMIYNTSLYEMGIWIVGLLLFIASPSQLFYVWFLILHVPRSVLGFVLLSNMPKTFEIIENVAKNPNFEEDKIITMLQAQIRESFIVRWTDNRMKFLIYLISTLVCTLIDLIMLIVMIAIFGNNNYVLLEICMLFVAVALIGKCFIYLLMLYSM